MADVLVARHDRVTVFTLNRPQKLNAMTRAMGQEFMQAFGDFEADPDQHVAVITGAGDRAFSAGADLTDLAARNKETVLWNAYLKGKRQTERGAAGKPYAYVVSANQHDPLTADLMIN